MSFEHFHKNQSGTRESLSLQVWYALLQMHRCVYLLNRKYDIHVCLNVNGTYETTPAAEVLQLSSYFTVPSNTTGTGGGYIIIHHPNFVLDRAVVTCSVNMSTFTGISYYSLRLKGTSRYILTNPTHCLELQPVKLRQL